MQRMGYGKHAKRSSRSPFRSDTKPSWGIYTKQDRWLWKDHGTGEGGDEVDFIIKAKNMDPMDSFGEALGIWASIAEGCTDIPVEVAKHPPEPRSKPNASGFGPGTDGQLDRLARLRDIDPRGLSVARQRGLLVFGTFIGHEVFGITDASGNLLEVRRLDGHPFPAKGEIPERKAHALKGSMKSWPVGITNAGSCPVILLVEGLPDFLAAFEVLVREDALDRVAPVALLSASVRIDETALPLFKGRRVRIIPHGDTAGAPAAVQWTRQLRNAGAAWVDQISLERPGDDDPVTVKDLNDYLPIHRQEMASANPEGRLLP